VRHFSVESLPSYEEEFSRSIKEPETFWEEKAAQVHWFKKWDQVLDNSVPPFGQWFKGGG